MIHKIIKRDFEKELLTKCFIINPKETTFETLLPDGRYILLEFNKMHKIIEKNIWKIA